MLGAASDARPASGRACLRSAGGSSLPSRCAVVAGTVEGSAAPGEHTGEEELVRPGSTDHLAWLGPATRGPSWDSPSETRSACDALCWLPRPATRSATERREGWGKPAADACGPSGPAPPLDLDWLFWSLKKQNETEQNKTPWDWDPDGPAVGMRTSDRE